MAENLKNRCNLQTPIPSGGATHNKPTAPVTEFKPSMAVNIWQHWLLKFGNIGCKLVALLTQLVVVLTLLVVLQTQHVTPLTKLMTRIVKLAALLTKLVELLVKLVALLTKPVALLTKPVALLVLIFLIINSWHQF